MRTTRTATTLAALGLVAAPVLAATPASAATAAGTPLTAVLEPLNDSAVNVQIEGSLAGNELTLEFSSQELLSNARHAQHIYIGGKSVCPDPMAPGKGTNQALRVTDAKADFGDAVVALTTSGDTSTESALDFQRYPLGSTPYKRTVTVTNQVASAILANKAVIVQLGTDLNDNGRYDGEGRSDLNPDLPEEATAPASCGILTVGNNPLPARRGLPSGITQLSQVPVGGVQTGGGATSGVEHVGLLAAGSALVAAGLGLARRRRSRKG